MHPNPSTYINILEFSKFTHIELSQQKSNNSLKFEQIN